MAKYLLSLLMLMTSLMSFGAEFVVGTDYEIIKNDKPSRHLNKNIPVTEFFSFGCPWCYRLEPALNRWVHQQGSKINFKKIPVIFNKDWDYYAKAYYTAEALSLNSILNPALFKAILNDKKHLNSQQAMIDFLTQHGVDLTTAKSAFDHSPSIELNLVKSQRLMVNYRINAVPAIIINDQFKTDLQMAKTEERLFAILDYLLTKSAQKTPQ